MDRTAIIPPAKVRAELERVLASGPFANSQRSQRFLRYVVNASLNNVDESLKEFAIAVDVFERNTSYDPSVDATVRVEAGRLRTRLSEYYAEAGRTDPIIIAVPKGGYRATLIERSAGPGAAAAHADSAPNAEIAHQPMETTGGSRTAPLAHSAVAHSRNWILPASLIAVATALLATTLGPHPLVMRLILGKAQPEIMSLAVIPLDNLSGDPGQEYFADGMTDELITMLAKDSSLRIVSRTSAMQYKSARRPLPQIARELGVDGILEGSISRSGNRVHMNIQLIQASTDTHLYAESYDRDVNEVAALPHEMAEAIAKRLNSSIASTSPPHYINPEAHDAYLHGRYLWYAHQNFKAFEYFKKATEMQPDYAPGWSGISMYYGAGVIEGELDPALSLVFQQEAAVKAVKLDDSFREAHLNLCAAIFTNEWDFNRANQECLRATELDPKFAEAFHLRAKLLGAFNRNDEAIEV